MADTEEAANALGHRLACASIQDGEDDCDCDFELAEAIELLRQVCRSFEAYSAARKPREEWDEYDHAINPAWLKAIAFISSRR